MSNNYFDDMGSAIDEDEEIEEELDDDRDYSLDDGDEVSLDDGLSDHEKDHYVDLDFDDNSKKETPIDLQPEKKKKVQEDIEEYDGPSLSDNNMTMNMDMDNPDYSDFSNLPDNSDLSLSTFKDNGKTHRKKKNKILMVLLIVALSCCAVAGVVVYAIFQRDAVPQVRDVHIECDNFDDHSKAKYGNMITLVFSFNKNIENLPTVIIMGRQVEVFGEGNSFYAKYFVEDPGDQDEKVSFTIKDYYDSFHKVGVPVTNTTDGSSVTILGFDNQ